jgi:O-antigen/teichoic acid export membrane protein
LSGNGKRQGRGKGQGQGRGNRKGQGRGKGGGRGQAGPKRPDKAGDAGTGAALGTQVLRYSGIHGIGMVANNAITFAATIIIANFSSPAEFGQLGLLLFYAGLLTLVFTLGSKQGTLKRTFGGDDEDDDDEEEDDPDEELATTPKRSFGTGISTITIVATIGTALSIIFADPISHSLLGNADPNLIVYAALAGGTGALYRLTSIAIWIERRPYSYIAVEISKPLFTLAAVVPLLIAGFGIKGAIAGQAIGTGLAMILSLIILRGSWTFCWDWREAIAIYRKGAIRVPLVLSMWVVGYADIFILSRFVSHTDLGTYHLASKAAFLVAILPGGYRKALRPLQKTPMFRAVEDEYGVGNARGVQFGYFTFILAATMLMTTVMATVIVRVAPASYSSAAPLIPLVAGGLVAPTVYRMINKSVKYADKRGPFIIGAIVAMLSFVGLSLLLIPHFGVKGTPLAMMLAFAIPTVFVFIKSQGGRSPIVLPWRPMFVTCGLAVAVAVLHSLIDPGGLIAQLILGVAAMVLWVALCLFCGAIPAAHRGALLGMVKGLKDKSQGFEAEVALAALRPRERKSLRRAIVRELPPQEAAIPALRAEGKNGDLSEDDATAILVEILRRAAIKGGANGVPKDYARTDNHDRDAQIGAYLFARETIAERDQMGKKLINDAVAEPFDLHTLEAVIGSLRRVDKAAWSGTKDDG